MSVVPLLAEAPALADVPLNDDTVSPGVLGLAVFVALLVATVLLLRSMTKQLKKIQAPREADLKQQEWERAEAEKAAEKAASTAATGDAAKIDKAATAPADDDES
ncbi:hypothetical protein [Actinomadura sp. KC216]|uniref:hypothetical protein n=1 Tax=Actinomadura sp. KC216 TaxID=2530370 RepID=UPI001A9FB0D9|nr:hypothetical protein [Actinomadura sp. KC216]